MIGSFPIRRAMEKDAGFIAEAIIAAEKMGTHKMGLALLFDLTISHARELLIRMLQEESEGNEFSLNCFLIMEDAGQPVAAVAAWIENYGDNIPSQKIKANLIRFIFPAEKIQAAQSRSDLAKDIYLEREKNSLQVEFVYTKKEYRGRGLAGQLIARHIKNALLIDPAIEKAQVQVFRNNSAAIAAYEKAGFTYVRSARSENAEIVRYFPGDEKILMERIINK